MESSHRGGLITEVVGFWLKPINGPDYQACFASRIGLKIRLVKKHEAILCFNERSPTYLDIGECRFSPDFWGEDLFMDACVFFNRRSYTWVSRKTYEHSGVSGYCRRLGRYA
jgi:hypothetical protein